MATWYSQGSGLWSTLSNWNDAADGSGSAPGSIAAFDDSPVVIQEGHVIEFDVEDAVACDGSVSGWPTGIAGITITGSAAGTPGELTLTDTNNNAMTQFGKVEQAERRQLVHALVERIWSPERLEAYLP